MEKIDPKSLNLPPRTVLRKRGTHHIAIVIKRKSRIIMADGEKVLAKASEIKKHPPWTRVSVETNAPVCRKTTKYLAENGIEIEFL